MATFSTCPVRGLILGFKNTDQVKKSSFQKTQRSRQETIAGCDGCHNDERDMSPTPRSAWMLWSISRSRVYTSVCVCQRQVTVVVARVARSFLVVLCEARPSPRGKKRSPPGLSSDTTARVRPGNGVVFASPHSLPRALPRLGELHGRSNSLTVGRQSQQTAGPACSSRPHWCCVA